MRSFHGACLHRISQCELPVENTLKGGALWLANKKSASTTLGCFFMLIPPPKGYELFYEGKKPKRVSCIPNQLACSRECFTREKQPLRISNHPDLMHCIPQLHLGRSRSFVTTHRLTKEFFTLLEREIEIIQVIERYWKLCP